MNIKQILFGLLILGVIVSQQTSWDVKDDSANDSQWSVATGNEGTGLSSDPTKCGNDSDYTLITGTTTINGQTTTEEQCWLNSESQACAIELGDLDAVNYDASNQYGDVRNECRIRDVAGQQYFDFIISYVDDYEIQDNCVRQEINFIEHDSDGTYVPGTSDPDTDVRTRVNVPQATTPYAQDPNNNNEYPHDEWYWNDTTDQLTFTIDFEDLVDQWLCEYNETIVDGNEVYQWICDIELNIYFSGEIQYSLEFQSVTTLDRTVSDTMDVTVQRNVVVGECCENTLQVESELFFCTNFVCTENDTQGNPVDPANDHSNKFFEDENTATWIDDGTGTKVKRVERRQKFYVAHRINTAEFQTDYYLQPVSLHVGPFVPLIHQWKFTEHPDTDTTNDISYVLLYEVESFIALDKLTITSVALLDDKTSTTLDDTDGPFADIDGYGGFTNNTNRRNRNRNRRFLSEQIGEDYKIKAEGNISVGEPVETTQQQQQETVQSSIVLQFGLVLMLVLALF